PAPTHLRRALALRHPARKGRADAGCSDRGVRRLPSRPKGSRVGAGRCGNTGRARINRSHPFRWKTGLGDLLPGLDMPAEFRMLKPISDQSLASRGIEWNGPWSQALVPDSRYFRFGRAFGARDSELGYNYSLDTTLIRKTDFSSLQYPVQGDP